MMYPALLNLQLSEIKKLRSNPKPILLSLVSNWIVAPLVAVALANLFLKGNDQLMLAVILLGSSPCTAMVLVWGRLAEGNQEQNVINTSINTLTIMVLYVPIVSLLTGLQASPSTAACWPSRPWSLSGCPCWRASSARGCWCGRGARPGSWASTARWWKKCPSWRC
jgi:ACR3 family arsenite efflux pump ArsB